MAVFPRAHIVLVHGTAAPLAPWTLPGSKVVDQLSKELSGIDVSFSRVEWRGFLGSRLNNSHRYRLRGGKLLAQQALKILTEEPGTRLFFIGHSHGGNVCLYALRWLDPQSVAGIVCMSTPFILTERKVRRTSLISSRRDFWHSMSAVVGIFGSMGSFVGMMLLFSSFRPDTMPEKVLVCLPICACLSCSALISSFAERVNPMIPPSPFALLPFPIGKLWVGGSGWDEAGAWLTLNDAFRGMLDAVDERIVGSLGAIVASVSSVLLLMDANAHPYYLLILPVLGAILGYVLPAYLLKGAIDFLLRAHCLGYGIEGFNHAFHYRLSVGRTPTGVVRWNGYVLPGKGLVHSRLYENEVALSDIGRWIKSRL